MESVNSEFCLLLQVVGRSQGIPKVGEGIVRVADLRMLKGWSTWVAQWVKASAFSSGHDPKVLESRPVSGSAQQGACFPSSLSACLSAYLWLLSVK